MSVATGQASVRLPWGVAVNGAGTRRVPIGAPGSRLPLVVGAGAAVVGAVGAWQPLVFVAVAVIIGGIAISAAAHRYPAPALSVGFVLLPIAQTKFRVRAFDASAAGQLDAQILLELGIYGLLGVIAVFAASSRRFRAQRLTHVEQLLAAYVAVVAGSVLWSLTPTLTIVKGVQLAILFLLAVVSVRVLGAEGLMHAVALAVVPYVLVCSAIAATVPAAYARAVPHSPIARFSWFYVHPIAAAILTGFAIIATWTRTRFEARPDGRRMTAGAVAVLVALLAVLALTRSRVPALAVFAAIVVITLRMRAPQWVTAVTAAGAVVVVGIYLSVGPNLVKWVAENSDNALIRFALRNDTANEIATLSGRDELWKAARQLFEAHPGRGYGYGGTRLMLLAAVPWAGDAHNALIQSVIDVGVVGTVPLLAAMGIGLAAALTRPRQTAPGRREYVQAAALAYLVFVLLNATTDIAFAEPGFIFLLVACSVIAAERLRAERAPAVAR